MAYANTVPLRLNAVVVIGAGAGSKAGKKLNLVFWLSATTFHSLFKRVRASLSQKCIVPSEPGKNISGKGNGSKTLTAGRECAVHRMERNIINGEDKSLIF
jgi:hypothetical protein